MFGRRFGSGFSCGVSRSSRRSANDWGGLDVIQFWPTFIDIRLALLFELLLIGTRAVTVLVVEHLHDLHAIGNLAEWRESLVIERTVIFEVDKHLRGPCI